MKAKWRWMVVSYCSFCSCRFWLQLQTHHRGSDLSCRGRCLFHTHLNHAHMGHAQLLLRQQHLGDAAEVTDRGLSCSLCSISSRKLMIECSLACDSRAPPSGSAGI
ncbi:hypothetical protein JZ751_019177 [Albula glossodonta]|uniref:Secreted protein n=1 Tax=Albula glossodonta TaxID=121402 RepID=A0A8T2N0K1_9TELE|nr:hypothetical protein JZ751_019177 [Albula glossodonta]